MLEKVTDPRDVFLVEGHVPIRHRYTPGVAGEAFFTALKDRGVLLGSRCETDGITYAPARLFCERCFAQLEADTEVGPGGVLESFTIGYAGLEGEALPEPVALGLVRLDGADTLLVHFVVDAEELEIGMPVVADVLPKGKRAGTIHDIRGFKPA